MLGLTVNNESTTLVALSKLHEVQDFTLPRKRGRPKKKTGGSKK